MKNILVTGSSGGIGSILVNKLLHLGYQVTGIDINEPGIEQENPNFVFLQGSICNDKFLQSIKWRSFENIVHLAATSSLPECEFNPLRAFEDNLIGTLKLVEQLKKHGSQGIIFASTSAIYENNFNYPFDEEMPVSPHLIYSQTKFYSEKFLESTYRSYGIPYITLRFFNVIGPYQNYKRQSPPLVNYIIRELLHNRQPILHSDGTQKRDYISVHDVCQAIILSLDIIQSSPGVYNICSQELYNVRNLFQIIADNMESSLKPIYRESNKLWKEYSEQEEYSFPLKLEIVENETNKLSLGTFEKFNKVTGWKPQTTIVDAIKEIVDISKDLMR